MMDRLKMPKNRRITVHTFLLYLVMLCLPLMLIISVFSFDNMRRAELNYRTDLQVRSTSLLKSVNDKLASFSSTGYTIFTSRWYSHYNTYSSLYQDEFDYLKRMEISAELTTRLIPMEYVADILIITPTMDQVIHKIGWYSLKEYQDYFGDVTILEDTITQMPVIKVPERKSHSIFQIQIMDPNNRFHQTAISVLVNKAAFATYIDDRSLGHLYARFYDSEQTLYENGGASATGFVVEPEPGGIIRARFIYPAFRQARLPGLLKSYLLLMLVVFLASILVVSFVTFKKALSLNALLSRLTDKHFPSEQDAYRYIGGYIDTVSLANKQIRTENHQLNERLDRFFENQRKDLLIGMLTNPHFTFDDEHSISWFIEGLPFMIALLPPATPANIALSPDCCSHWQFVTLPKEEHGLVAWFADLAAAQKQLPLLVEFLEDHIPSDSQLLVSPLLSDPHQLCDAYLSLSSKSNGHPHDRKQDKTIVLIKEYIDEYYTDPNMSMKLLEERFGLVGAIISKKFKSETGKTFSDYLLERRIATAEYLLNTTSKSVSMIAEAVGYSNYISFKRAFIRQKEVSPRNYRERSLKMDVNG